MKYLQLRKDFLAIPNYAYFDYEDDYIENRRCYNRRLVKKATVELGGVNDLLFIDTSILKYVNVNGERVFENNFEYETKTVTVTPEIFVLTNDLFSGNAYVEGEIIWSSFSDYLVYGPFTKNFKILNIDDFLDTDVLYMIMYYPFFYGGFQGINIPIKDLKKYANVTNSVLDLLNAGGRGLPLDSEDFGILMIVGKEEGIENWGQLQVENLYTTHIQYDKLKRKQLSVTYGKNDLMGGEELFLAKNQGISPFSQAKLSSTIEILPNYTFIVLLGDKYGNNDSAFLTGEYLINNGIFSSNWEYIGPDSFTFIMFMSTCELSDSTTNEEILENVVDLTITQNQSISPCLHPHPLIINGIEGVAEIEFEEYHSIGTSHPDIIDFYDGSHDTKLNFEIVKAINRNCYYYLPNDSQFCPCLASVQNGSFFIPKFYHFQKAIPEYSSNQVIIEHGHVRYHSTKNNDGVIENDTKELVFANNSLYAIPEGVVGTRDVKFLKYFSGKYLTLPITFKPNTYGLSSNIEYLTINGDYAERDKIFGMNNLKKLTLGKKVNTIGEGAFSGYTHLNSIKMNGIITINNSGFTNCSNLNKVVFSNKLTKIGNYAFSGCTNLETVKLPKNIREIGYRVFDGTGFINNNPENIIYDGTYLLQVKDPTLLNGEHIINEGTKIISNNIFRSCTGLTSCIIPSSVKTMPLSMFYGCSNLTSVKIPSSIETIGSYVFYGCSKLQSIVIPDTVKSLGDYAFYNCTKLSSIVLSKNISQIRSNTFSGCTSLPVINNIRYADTCLVEVTADNIDLTFQKNTKILAPYAFQKRKLITPDYVIPNTIISISWGVFQYSNLTSIEIPNSVIFMDGAVFYGCTSLKRVKMSNTFKSVPDRTFYNCSALTEVIMPEDINEIGPNAFNGCRSLTEFTIGEHVKSIGEDAFTNCRNLKTITFKSLNEPTFTNNIGIANSNTVTIYYPSNGNYTKLRNKYNYCKWVAVTF